MENIKFHLVSTTDDLTFTMKNQTNILIKEV